MTLTQKLAWNVGYNYAKSIEYAPRETSYHYEVIQALLQSDYVDLLKGGLKQFAEDGFNSASGVKKQQHAM